MRNRVAEFEGAGQLAEAGQTLLGDPALDMAVVHGAAPLPGNWGFGGGDQSDIAAFYHHVPAATKLDKVVADWGRQQLPREGLRLLPGIAIAFPTYGPISAHMDFPKRWATIVDGPLTMSLRIDRHSSVRRTFYAQRARQNTLGEDGRFYNGGHTRSSGFLGGIHRLGHVGLVNFSCAEQNPGDIVIIPNHPNAAKHAVRSTEDPRIGKTAALVASYGFQRNRQNTNSG